MVKAIEFDSIGYHPQRRKYSAIRVQRDCWGVDAETTPDGYARIIADAYDWKRIKGFNDVIEFLTNHRFRDKINVFWNLSFDFDVLFKHNRKLIEQIYAKGKVKHRGYQISYLPGKCLTIRHGHKSYKFFDVAQFYYGSLGKNAERYLGHPENKMKDERGKLFELYPDDAIGRYSQEDSYLAQELGNKIIGCFNTMGLKVRHPYSCAHIAQEGLLRDSDIPVNCLPKPVARLYWKAHRGGWFDTYRRGMFKATQYDVSSSYPATMRELPDIRDGVWSSGLDETCELGVLYAEVSGDLSKCQPLPIKAFNINIYPVLDKPIKLALTLSEYRVLKEFLSIKVLEAYHFKETGEVRHPFAKSIERIYGFKNAFDWNTLEYATSKLIMVSLYGKTAELRRINGKLVPGKLFNPCYAAEITARTRMKVFSAIQPFSEKVVSILCDGIIFDSPVSIKTGSGLGDFILKERNRDCLMVMNGVHQFRDRTPVTKGFSRKNDLFSACDSDKPGIEVKTFRPMHYKECMARKDFEGIGRFVEETKCLNVNRDLKRMWPDPVLEAKVLLTRSFDSLPVPVSTF